MAVININITFTKFQIAENFDMPFFEVSCKQNINIEECFLTLARSIREQREHRVSFSLNLLRHVNDHTYIFFSKGR